MSGFVGIFSSVDTVIDKVDLRGMFERYRPEFAELRDAGPAVGDLSVANPWWPGSGGLEGDAAPMLAASAGYEGYDLTGGALYRFVFSGVTRDVYGSPLGGVTVKAYRVSTDEMVGSATSDPVGSFIVTTPYYPDAHYLVFYKAGFPDVFGTTVNTLIGT